MSEEEELQAEEKEVLVSIYEGDDSFKQISPTTYQYKYGESENESFVLELSWGPKYPNEKPTYNIDIFHNRNILQSVKDSIISTVDAEAEQLLGSAMTYTLFECLKEKVPELMDEQKNSQISVQLADDVAKVTVDSQESEASKKADKKEQLTKAQKRRAWDRAEAGRGGERARGHDWVDIVKHLSHVPHDHAAS